jgi:hypothetical protein
MGKLFVKIVLVLFFIQISYAQERLCVYKVSGIVTLNKKTKSLSKGSIIHKKDMVKLSAKSKLIAIDDEGSLFELDKLGIYIFSDILKNKKATDKSGLTTKYFKFVWSELTHEKEAKNSIAGVFRGNVLMNYPPENASISGQKIIMKWDGDSQTAYYLFVRNVTDDSLIKLETNGNQIALYFDSAIFTNGNAFEWSVSTEEFPNLKNIPFYRFTTISYSEYSDEIKKHQPLIEELQELGLTEYEINYEICKNSGLCDGSN